MLFNCFYAILRQISNFCFCATSSRELAVCAIFYSFSNYDSKPPVMFQTIDAVIKRSNFRLKKLGEILKNISIQIDILNWNRINQQNTFKWTIWCVYLFPKLFSIIQVSSKLQVTRRSGNNIVTNWSGNDIVTNWSSPKHILWEVCRWNGDIL